MLQKHSGFSSTQVVFPAIWVTDEDSPNGHKSCQRKGPISCGKPMDLGALNLSHGALIILDQFLFTRLCQIRKISSELHREGEEGRVFLNIPVHKPPVPCYLRVLI